MHRIDSSTATPDGRFTEGNPTIPVPATTVTADWLNAMQEEAIAVLAAAGIAPDKANNAQLLAAILKLIADSTPGIATSEKNGICRPDGVTIKIDASGKVSVVQADKYDLGEFYYFRHPTLKPGFAPLQGGLISGDYQGKHITEYPIWQYLQTAEGRLLLKTESEWQAMTRGIWHTNADGSTVGWNGIGGAPFYVQDMGAGTLRMADVRGMYPEAAGFDALGVGGVHGDMIRNIIAWHCGDAREGYDFGPIGASSVASGARYLVSNGSGTQFWMAAVNINTARQVPIGAANKPRAWGALACCYLGTPVA